jgi:gamma-aminobutyric acid type B receptor
MVTGFLLVDLVLLLTWQLQDPLQRRIEVFPLEDPVSTDDDIKIRPELEHCESENNNVWLGETKMIMSFLDLLIINLPENTRNRDVKVIMNIYYLMSLSMLSLLAEDILLMPEEFSFSCNVTECLYSYGVFESFVVS